MDAVRNEGGREAIFAQLRENGILVPLKERGAAIAEMSGEACAEFSRSLDDLCTGHRMSNGDDDAFARKLVNKQQGAWNLGCDSHHADQAVGRLLPAAPEFEIGRANVLDGMCAASAVFGTDEWALEMKTGNTGADSGIDLQRFHQDLKEVFDLVRTVGNDRGKNCGAARFPHGADGLADFDGSGAGMIEINACKTVALQVGPRRSADIFDAPTASVCRGNALAFDEEILRLSGDTIRRNEFHAAAIHR
jgi:hypothetical protein